MTNNFPEKSIFISPSTNDELFYQREENREFLLSEKGETFEFSEGFPDLTFPKKLDEKAVNIRQIYNDASDIYDQFLHQTFKTHNEDETTSRQYIIDKLKQKSDSKVLEIACGTGRDSELIAQRLGENSQFVMVDLTPSMMKRCQLRLSTTNIEKIFCIANACYLPFPDKYFDAVYCFAAVGVFPDIKKSLAEMTRVTKTGGKIVFSDESMPLWLRDTYFSKVLANTNPKVLWEVPLKEIPVSARNVTVQWIIGGIFYLIDFEVGEGEPVGNFDYPVEGPVRGGTLRTRYEGRLEGVTKEAKELVYKAAKAKGLTIHQWLDSVVKEAANKDLNLEQ